MAIPLMTYFGTPDQTGLTVVAYVMSQTGESVSNPVTMTESVSAPGIYTAPIPPASGGGALDLGIYLVRFYNETQSPFVILSEPAVIYWDGETEVDPLNLSTKLDGLPFLRADDGRLNNLNATISSRSSHGPSDVVTPLAILIDALDEAPTTAEIRAEIDNALIAYDVPNLSELNALFEQVMGTGFDVETDSLMAIRDRGDEAWTGGVVIDPGNPESPILTDQMVAYNTLCDAINQGVLKVKYSDKEVQYRSLEEMWAIKRSMEQQLGIGSDSGVGGTGKRIYSQHDKHLS